MQTPSEVISGINQNFENSKFEDYQAHIHEHNGTVLVSRSESGELEAEVVTGLWHSFRAMVISWFRSAITETDRQHFTGEAAQQEIFNKLIGQVQDYTRELEKFSSKKLEFEASDLAQGESSLKSEVEKLSAISTSIFNLEFFLKHEAIDSYRSAVNQVKDMYYDQSASQEILIELQKLPKKTDSDYMKKGVELIERYQSLSEKNSIADDVVEQISTLQSDLRDLALGGVRVDSFNDDGLVAELKQANEIHALREELKGLHDLMNDRQPVQGKEIRLFQSVNELQIRLNDKKSKLEKCYPDEVNEIQRELSDLYTVAFSGIDVIRDEISNLKLERHSGEALEAYEERMKALNRRLSLQRISVEKINDENVSDKRSEILILIDQKQGAVKEVVDGEVEMIALVQGFSGNFGDISVANNPEEAFRLIEKSVKSKLAKGASEPSAAYLVRLSEEHQKINALQSELILLADKVKESDSERKHYFLGQLESIGRALQLKQDSINRNFSGEVEIMLSKGKRVRKASKKALKQKNEEKQAILKNLHKTVHSAASVLPACRLPDPSIKESFPIASELDEKLRDYDSDGLIAAPMGSKGEKWSSVDMRSYQYEVQNWILSEEFKVALPGLIHFIRDVKLAEAEALHMKNQKFREESDRAIATVKKHFPKYRDFDPMHFDIVKDVQKELSEFAEELDMSYIPGGTLANASLIGPGAVETLNNLPGLLGFGKKYSEEEVRSKMRLAAHQLQLLDAVEAMRNIEASRAEVMNWTRYLELLESLENFSTSSADSIQSERDKLASLETEIHALSERIKEIEKKITRLEHTTLQ